MIIDPQNDFCDPSGALFVSGKDEDMKRLANMVMRLSGRCPTSPLQWIHFDTWTSPSRPGGKTRRGKLLRPSPSIPLKMWSRGRWTTRQPSFLSRSLEYLQVLERRGRYPHCIWPVHCLIGDEGHNVFPKLAEAVHTWEWEVDLSPNDCLFFYGRHTYIL